MIEKIQLKYHTIEKLGFTDPENTAHRFEKHLHSQSAYRWEAQQKSQG